MPRTCAGRRCETRLHQYLRVFSLKYKKPTTPAAKHRVNTVRAKAILRGFCVPEELGCVCRKMLLQRAQQLATALWLQKFRTNLSSLITCYGASRSIENKYLAFGLRHGIDKGSGYG